MPITNPEDVLKSSFKNLVPKHRRRSRSREPHGNSPKHAIATPEGLQNNAQELAHDIVPQNVTSVYYAQGPARTSAASQLKPTPLATLDLEPQQPLIEVLVQPQPEDIEAIKEQTPSILYSEKSFDTRSFERSYSAGPESVYDHNHTEVVTVVRKDELAEQDPIPPYETLQEAIKTDGSPIDDGGSFDAAITVDSGIGEPVKGKRKRRGFFKRKFTGNDRRRSTWLPCTCPQYKVSRELATKWQSQGLFFGKVMVAKVIQLLIINLITFTIAFQRENTLKFFKRSHDWSYMALGLFVVLTLCIRVMMTYRARWPIVVAVIPMIPLTCLIAFSCACVTVVHNSILIPFIISTVLLSYMMLSFTPYILRKFVMHRVTNLAAFGFTLLSSIILLFLKEFEEKEISYWQFVAHVWLPGLVLAEIVVLVSVFEIQRMLFGLCFNVSTKRWHIAAVYL